MAHVCSMFSQRLQVSLVGSSNRPGEQHWAPRSVKRHTCWGQLVALQFCQPGHLSFLREVCKGMASCESTLKHLGFKEMPNKPIECRGVPSLRISVR
jgi:hypothetical protein